ncbi:MAG TPA: class I SAM-dependent methyltransferase [Candidatus Methylomirabilis sp.]|nr:class I SAM-dependent methyltransferase [Candidatus Methylomirabilis sp.]
MASSPIDGGPRRKDARGRGATLVLVSDARKPQNIYDDPVFFAGYSTLERFGVGWERAMEHADLLALLPSVTGRRVLDLGCGVGQLARHLATSGAVEVVGVDVSERMLSVARAEWAHPGVTYRQEAIEETEFPPARFDLIVSSLVLHYVLDYAGLTRRIAGWLAPGGVFVYSVEHPIFTARLPGDGWVLDGAGQRVRFSLDRYADEGAREEAWFVPGVRKIHRTFATLINGLTDAGLMVERIVEPVPSEAWLQDRPQFRDERRRPVFLLVRAKKPGPLNPVT